MSETMLQTWDFFDKGACYPASDRDQGRFFPVRDSVFCGDSDIVAMTLQELAETALGLAVAVHGSDVEVTDACLVGGFKDGK